MPLEKKYAQIEAEIAAGKLYQARDRLHGLLASFPNDLRIRHRLGDIYYDLQYPVMAGKYWWPVPPEGANALRAIAAFEHACGGNVRVMRRRSRPHFCLDELPDGPARERIRELGIGFTRKQMLAKGESQYAPARGTPGAPCGQIVLLLLVVILGLAVVGAMTLMGVWSS